jgi:hypothetical protein
MWNVEEDRQEFFVDFLPLRTRMNDHSFYVKIEELLLNFLLIIIFVVIWFLCESEMGDGVSRKEYPISMRTLNWHLFVSFFKQLLLQLEHRVNLLPFQNCTCVLMMNFDNAMLLFKMFGSPHQWQVLVISAALPLKKIMFF